MLETSNRGGSHGQRVGWGCGQALVGEKKGVEIKTELKTQYHLVPFTYPMDPSAEQLS